MSALRSAFAGTLLASLDNDDDNNDNDDDGDRHGDGDSVPPLKRSRV